MLKPVRWCVKAEEVSNRLLTNPGVHIIYVSPSTVRVYGTSIAWRARMRPGCHGLPAEQEAHYHRKEKLLAQFQTWLHRSGGHDLMPSTGTVLTESLLRRELARRDRTLINNKGCYTTQLRREHLLGWD